MLLSGAVSGTTSDNMGTAASSGGHHRCKYRRTWSTHDPTHLSRYHAGAMSTTHMKLMFTFHACRQKTDLPLRAFHHITAQSVPSKRWTKANGGDGGIRAELERLTKELKVHKSEHMHKYHDRSSAESPRVNATVHLLSLHMVAEDIW